MEEKTFLEFKIPKFSPQKSEAGSVLPSKKFLPRNSCPTCTWLVGATEKLVMRMMELMVPTLSKY
jgi:hypothetical protein